MQDSIFSVPAPKRVVTRPLAVSVRVHTYDCKHPLAEKALGQEPEIQVVLLLVGLPEPVECLHAESNRHVGPGGRTPTVRDEEGAEEVEGAEPAARHSSRDPRERRDAGRRWCTMTRREQSEQEPRSRRSLT
eukprot:330259-Rhodomonas_salina.2